MLAVVTLLSASGFTQTPQPAPTPAAEQVTLRMIVVSSQEDAKRILSQLRQGQDFAPGGQAVADEGQAETDRQEQQGHAAAQHKERLGSQIRIISLSPHSRAGLQCVGCIKCIDCCHAGL